MTGSDILRCRQRLRFFATDSNRIQFFLLIRHKIQFGLHLALRTCHNITGQLEHMRKEGTGCAIYSRNTFMLRLANSFLLTINCSLFVNSVYFQMKERAKAPKYAAGNYRLTRSNNNSISSSSLL